MSLDRGAEKFGEAEAGHEVLALALCYGEDRFDVRLRVIHTTLRYGFSPHGQREDASHFFSDRGWVGFDGWVEEGGGSFFVACDEFVKLRILGGDDSVASAAGIREVIGSGCKRARHANDRLDAVVVGLVCVNLREGVECELRCHIRAEEWGRHNGCGAPDVKQCPRPPGAHVRKGCPIDPLGAERIDVEQVGDVLSGEGFGVTD